MKFLLIILLILSYTVLLFPAKLAILPDLQRPHSLTSDGEHIFVVDGVEAYVYSLKDYKLTAKFGKKGEGPSELLPHPEIPVQLHLFNGNVLLTSTTKMVYFTKTGKFLKEKVYPASFSSLVPFGKNFAAVKFSANKKGTPMYTVQLLDPEFKRIKTLLNSERPKPKRAGRGIKIPKLVYLRTYGETLYVLDQQDSSSIKIFDKAGKEKKSCKIDLPEIKMTDSLKAETLDDFKKSRAYKKYGINPQNLKNVFRFPEAMPAMRLFHVKDDTIYVQTYKRAKGLSDFSIVDMMGKIQKNVSLPIDVLDVIQIGAHTSYFFDKDKYYYLVENLDNEEWELHAETVAACNKK